MQVLHEFTSEPGPCAYLAPQTARMRYALALSLTAQEYEELMNQGYRKFGAIFFKPVCEACQACRSLRVPVARFQPDRSQRRALRDNADLELSFGPAASDAQRLELYQRYHRAQRDRRQWPYEEISADDYAASFVVNPVPNIEIGAWQGGRLAAVMHTDLTPHAVSAIYHFHDPELRQRGLGVFMILQAFELARRMEKDYVYLGYYVAGCPSMEYKMRYRPCEMLIDGRWQEVG